MGADRSQWQFPKNEADKILGWRSNGKGLENKTVADLVSGVIDQLGIVSVGDHEADTFIRRNSTNDGYEALTAPEVVTALNVKELNEDGGFSFELTGAPTNNLGPLFGLTNKTHHRIVSDTNSTHSDEAGDPSDSAWFAMSIVSNFLGSGGVSGGPQLDGALWVDAQKKGWTPGTAPSHVVGEGVAGPVTSLVIRAIDNEWGDNCGWTATVSKIMASDVPGTGTGGNLLFEGSVRSYDTDGVTLLRDTHVFLGWDQVNLSSSLHPGKASGVNVRPHVGNAFAAYVASAPSGGGMFDYFAFATSDTTQANAYFSITGNNHAAGPGLVRAGDGSVTTPSLSFQSTPGTGFYREGPGIIGWSNATGIKRGFFGNGFRVGSPSGGDPGAGGINISGQFQINGVNRINSAGRHVVTTASAADLGSAAASINTTGKALGVLVYNTDDQKLYVANGGTATAGWFPSDGGAAITPA